MPKKDAVLTLRLLREERDAIARAAAESAGRLGVPVSSSAWVMMLVRRALAGGGPGGAVAVPKAAPKSEAVVVREPAVRADPDDKAERMAKARAVQESVRMQVPKTEAEAEANRRAMLRKGKD